MRIAVILPSSRIRPGPERDAFDAGWAWLEARGHVLFAIGEAWHEGLAPWLAADDASRARAWREALASDAELVWMGRGGHGAARLVAALGPPVDVTVGQRFFGFSDGTALLAHHPRAWSAPPLVQIPRLDQPSLARLEEALAGHVSAMSLAPLGPPAAAAISGPLVGGNLTVLASLVGTPYLPSLDGILALEDVGEAAYRIDRMLHQLLWSGALERVRAVLLGDFMAGLPEREHASVRRALIDFFGGLGRPVFGGLPIGHGATNACLPWTRVVIDPGGHLEVGR